MPYDRFVLEQIAGDLLPGRDDTRPTDQRVDPRPPASSGWARRKQTPVDIRQEQADRIDNQIDVVRQGVPGPDRRLRPLPRPQVRPHLDAATTTPWPATCKARGTSRPSSTRRSGSPSRRGDWRHYVQSFESESPPISSPPGSTRRNALAAIRLPRGAKAGAVANAAREFGVDAARLEQWIKSLGQKENNGPDHPLFAWAQPAGADAPENRLLHRMPVRRLEAEAIRDAMLAVSGRLDPRDVRPERACRT